MASTSTSNQFASTARMHGIYDPVVLPPLHQISTSLWDVDSFPNSNTTVSPVHSTTTTKADYSSHESLGPASADTHPPKTHISDKLQRRLAQNREAARKSRLRKKVYVQQLESGRMKLAQLEQELERARQQGVYGGLLNTGNTLMLSAGMATTVNSAAGNIATFEMEYELWVGEQQKKECELRNVLLQAPHIISDNDLRLFVDSVLNHYYELFRMKADAAKADIFYLMSGAWRTPVERFFFWIGGFRPSELLAVLAPQLEPLTEPQLMSVSNLRHSCQQAEDALTQGMEKLQQTLAQSICICIDINAGSSCSYNTQLVSAMERLEALENFVNQADHLRQQTLQQMSRILTARQAARGLLALGEYLHRLQALSSLWSARTRGL